MLAGKSAGFILGGMTNPLILVVDDDAQIQKLVRELLERHHMRVLIAANVIEAEYHLQQARPDLMVLDVMMPGEDGTSFCRRLRHESRVPILMLSALSEDLDRIVGLEMGADDYLTKPFNPRELVARIKSILWRSSPDSQEKKATTQIEYKFERFCLRPDMRTLNSEQGEIQLTSGEFTLLLLLIEHAPRILSRDQLLELSRGSAANPFDRSIDTHISRLRAKLEPDALRPTLIKTIRNLGYAFAVPIKKIQSN